MRTQSSGAGVVPPLAAVLSHFAANVRDRTDRCHSFALVMLGEGGPVLRRSTDKVRHCYRCAAECRERALEAGDPDSKAAWQKVEDCWLALARRFELAESLSDFDLEVRWL